jgi:hypothetical protein
LIDTKVGKLLPTFKVSLDQGAPPSSIFILQQFWDIDGPEVDFKKKEHENIGIVIL